jgi:hypothetical protein
VQMCLGKSPAGKLEIVHGELLFLGSTPRVLAQLVRPLDGDPQPLLVAACGDLVATSCTSQKIALPKNVLTCIIAHPLVHNLLSFKGQGVGEVVRVREAQQKVVEI